MADLARSQYDPNNSLSTPPIFPSIFVHKPLEVFITQRHGQRYRLVKRQREVVVVARQDARGVDLLVAGLEDAGQLARRREGAPRYGGHGVSGVRPVFVLKFLRRCAGRVVFQRVVPEPGCGRGAEDPRACACEGHADAAQGDAAVEIADDDVGSAGRVEVQRVRVFDLWCHFALELKGESALSVDHVKILVRRKRYCLRAFLRAGHKF